MGRKRISIISLSAVDVLALFLTWTTVIGPCTPKPTIQNEDGFKVVQQRPPWLSLHHDHHALPDRYQVSRQSQVVSVDEEPRGLDLYSEEEVQIYEHKQLKLRFRRSNDGVATEAGKKTKGRSKDKGLQKKRSKDVYYSSNLESKQPVDRTLVKASSTKRSKDESNLAAKEKKPSGHTIAPVSSKPSVKSPTEPEDSKSQQEQNFASPDKLSKKRVTNNSNKKDGNKNVTKKKKKQKQKRKGRNKLKSDSKKTDNTEANTTEAPSVTSEPEENNTEQVTTFPDEEVTERSLEQVQKSQDSGKASNLDFKDADEAPTQEGIMGMALSLQEDLPEVSEKAFDADRGNDDVSGNEDESQRSPNRGDGDTESKGMSTEPQKDEAELNEESDQQLQNSEENEGNDEVVDAPEFSPGEIEKSLEPMSSNELKNEAGKELKNSEESEKNENVPDISPNPNGGTLEPESSKELENEAGKDLKNSEESDKDENGDTPHISTNPNGRSLAPSDPTKDSGEVSEIQEKNSEEAERESKENAPEHEAAISDTGGSKGRSLDLENDMSDKHLESESSGELNDNNSEEHGNNDEESAPQVSTEGKGRSLEPEPKETKSNDFDKDSGKKLNNSDEPESDEKEDEPKESSVREDIGIHGRTLETNQDEEKSTEKESETESNNSEESEMGERDDEPQEIPVPEDTKIQGRTLETNKDKEKSIEKESETEVNNSGESGTSKMEDHTPTQNQGIKGRSLETKNDDQSKIKSKVSEKDKPPPPVDSTRKDDDITGESLAPKKDLSEVLQTAFDKYWKHSETQLTKESFDTLEKSLPGLQGRSLGDIKVGEQPEAALDDKAGKKATAKPGKGDAVATAVSGKENKESISEVDRGMLLLKKMQMGGALW